VAKKNKKALKTELTVEVAPIRDEIPLFGGIIQNPDKVLQARGGGKGLETYEGLETDAHVRTVLSKRKRAVISREWFVNEADATPEAEKAAELVRDHISKLNIDKVTQDFLDAINKGFAVGEVIWAVDGSEIRPVAIKSRKQQRFTFLANEDNSCEMRLLTIGEPMKGIALPEKKFIHFAFDQRYENPYGFALGNSLFWPVFFKRKGITFWLVFCDKFGSPTAVGTYPASATKAEKEKLMGALVAIAQDAGVTVPEGMDVKLLEAAKSGIDTYEKLVRYMDEQISEVVLGETGTTNQSGQGGSNARDQVGNEVRLETAKADGDALCDCLNETLIKWIIDLNMPGAPYPKLWRDFSEPEDLVRKAQRDKSLTETGVKFRKQYYMREYNLQEDDFDLTEAKTEELATDRRPGEPAEFAEQPGNLPADFSKEKIFEAFVEGIDPALLQNQAEAMLGPIIKKIQAGQSYEEIISALAESDTGMSLEALTDVLERAYFLSSVWGRLNAG
jgi:phage gp29-like protein